MMNRIILRGRNVRRLQFAGWNLAVVHVQPRPMTRAGLLSKYQAGLCVAVRAVHFILMMSTPSVVTRLLVDRVKFEP
jgi:hypothetical protein